MCCDLFLPQHPLSFLHSHSTSSSSLPAPFLLFSGWPLHLTRAVCGSVGGRCSPEQGQLALGYSTEEYDLLPQQLLSCLASSGKDGDFMHPHRLRHDTKETALWRNVDGPTLVASCRQPLLMWPSFSGWTISPAPTQLLTCHGKNKLTNSLRPSTAIHAAWICLLFFGIGDWEVVHDRKSSTTEPQAHLLSPWCHVSACINMTMAKLTPIFQKSCCNNPSLFSILFPHMDGILATAHIFKQ